MTLSKSLITGHLNDATQIRFTLSAWDSELAEIVLSQSQTFDLVDGDIPDTCLIWQNQAGLRGTSYTVTAINKGADRFGVIEELGSIQVPEGASHALADLLEASSVITPGNTYNVLTASQYATLLGSATIAQLITAAAAGDFDDLADNSVVWAGGYPFIKQDGATYDRLPVGFIPRIPSPFAFRAVCDGVVGVVGGEAVLTSGTDDTAAWQALFAYCNDAGVEPDCRGVQIVCVQCDIYLTTMQNVDFCGAKLRLIGGLFDPETINLTSTARTFLEVIDPDCPVVTGTVTVDDANMVAGSLTPTLDFFTETGYCEIIADLANGPWTANRQRTALEPWRQPFAVVKEGVVVKPMARSMVGTGSVSYAYRRRSASGPVTIKNLQVDAELFNNQRIVRISRNDVRVENVCPAGNEYVESQNQLISVNYAAFIKITDCMGPSQGDTDESRASYFIHGSHCAEVTVEDSVSVGQPWGASGFNNVSGLYWRNPRMNRLDVHQAGFWIEVYGGTISQIGIGYGYGGGHLKVIGTTLVDCSVYHRPDWAGDFYGTIEVLSPSIMNSAYKAVVVDLHTKPLGSDLQSAQVPTVIVRDIHRLDTGLSASQITPIQIGLRAGAMALTPPQQFVVDGVTASSDYRCCNEICLEDMVAPGGASRLQVSFSNIIGALGYTDSSDFTLRVPATTTGGTGIKYDLRANNCHQVAFDTRNSPNARWYLSDLHTVGNYMADNCLSKQNDLTYGAPVILSGFTSSPVCGALTIGTFNFGSVVGGRMENAVSAWDFSNAKFIAGVVIPTSSTACVYPTGATREQMFSGWTPEMCGQVVLIRQTADRTLTATTAAQAIFDEGGFSQVDLAVGVYEMALQFRVENMDTGSSSNLRFDLLGGGTATLANIDFQSVGRDASNLTSSAGALSGIMSNTAGSLNLFNNATNSGAGGEITGQFEVTAAGKICPSFLLSVAAAATVKAGTSFRCEKIASASVAGPWSA